MLAKSRRLARDKDFENVFKSGKSFYSKFLGIKATANNKAENRYGIIISAKVSKKAVERNKLKRQLKEIFGNLDYKIKQGFDLAIVVLPAVMGQDFISLKSEAEKALNKLKLFK